MNGLVGVRRASTKDVPTMVRVVRTSARWRDRARNYRVVIDGAKVGSVADSDVAEFDVEPGRHTIRLRIDWTGSRELPFSIGEAGTVAFSCRPARGPAI
jgi:hypothetical protein